MVNLQLDTDEGIVLQATEVERYGSVECSLDEMVLTNKNLICVYQKSNGLFAKSETIIDKIPLHTIKVVNGKAQAMVYDNDDYGLGVQILFNDGNREHFVFYDSPKKTMPVWIDAINKVIVGEPEITEGEPPVIETIIETPKEKKGLFGGIAGALNFDIQGVVEKAQAKITEFPQQMAEKFEQLTNSEDSNEEPSVEQPAIQQTIIESNEVKFMFCSNCGTKLNEGAKFCHGCGVAVGTVAPATEQTPPPIPVSPSQGNPTERQQEFVGKILKCPHCGAVINETTAICPDCGVQLTGRAAVTSIQQFKDQLMAIEGSRKGGLGGVFGVYTPANKSDIQKLSLIRNFPIPNSIDDCLEFMMLAIANIDVSLSKNTLANRMSSNGQVETGATIGRTISNAWVAKMEQVYKKAEIVFPNDPAFAGIQKMYFDKMKELKIKVK